MIIGTWNLAACAKAWMRETWGDRVPDIANFIATCGASLFFLQETGSGDDLKLLRRELRRYRWKIVRGGGRWRHIVVPKGTPVRRAGLFELTAEKHAAWATIKLAGVWRFYVSVHLIVDDGRDLTYLRAEEIHDLCQLIEDKNFRDLDVVIGGDFNDDHELAPVWKANGYVDVFDLAAKHTNASHNSANALQNPPRQEMRHIDGFRIKKGSPIKVRRWIQKLFGTSRKYDLPFLSDHNPVLIEIN